MNYLDLDNELVILEKYDLTPTELSVLKYIILYQEDSTSNYLSRYLKSNNKSTFRDTLVSLQNKGIILKSYKIPNKGEKFDPNNIAINLNVVKTFWKGSYEIGKELFETYPMFAQINGALVSIRTISKKFNTPEDAFRYYGKVIRWNKELHNKIIELLKWEQDNDIHFINMSLSSFIIDQKWNELEALKDGKLVNINYDTIKSL